MLRLRKLPDYGLVIATVLAGSDNLLTTNDIVLRSKIPLATVRKILKYMVDAKLVDSYRGHKGGYQLAREPQDISIADVIQAIDGPIALTDCSGPRTNSRCALKPSCHIAPKLCRLNKEIIDKLQSISIKEFAS